MSLHSPDVSTKPAYWVIVPAAGVGTRMGAELPKQYLTLNGKTILEQTLERLLGLPRLSGIALALNSADDYWNQLELSGNPQIQRVDGGSERSYSVLNALNVIATQARECDWVLVHDAARPCVTVAAIAQLQMQLEQHSVGGILAIPVSDTLKKVNDKREIVQTVDRATLWQAQTPQMFRYGLLRRCLADALAEGRQITDEASALEAFGFQPAIVEGRADNIKITRPEDLLLAQLILQQQESGKLA